MYIEELAKNYSVMVEEGNVKNSTWGFNMRTAKPGSTTQIKFSTFACLLSNILMDKRNSDNMLSCSLMAIPHDGISVLSYIS